MTLALVFAMTGGAYAAKKYLITSTKQISPSVLKSLHGKAGPAGAQGPAGAVGPAGPQGAAGAPGKDGTGGKDGAVGKDGKSVTVAETASKCPEGGLTVEVEGSGVKREVCNGTEGAKGPAGSPWTAGGTLPAGSTETGAWGVSGRKLTNEKEEEGANSATAVVSFAVPLAQALDSAHVYLIKVGETVPSECENSEHAGTASAANPEATSGYLCVYVAAKLNAAFEGILDPTAGAEGASAAGATFKVNYELQLFGRAFSAAGTYAVTG
jgi:hypothetical protein